MSLAAAYPQEGATGGSVPANGRKALSSYIKESRNLLRMQEEHRRSVSTTTYWVEVRFIDPVFSHVKMKCNFIKYFCLPRPYCRSRLIHRGKLNIVSFLNDLPRTEHDTANLCVDVHFSADTIITLSLSGLFRERQDAQHGQPLRHFNRMFVLTAQGSGWSIVNETLFVTNPTARQVRDAFKAGGATAAPATAQSPASQQQQQQQPAPDAAAQMAMMQQLAQKTNMNEKFTRM